MPKPSCTLTAFNEAHDQATMGILAAIKVAADFYVTPGDVDPGGTRKRAAESIALLGGAFQCLRRATK